MIYPEELAKRYNECMCEERSIIQRFLKDQYDLRYGRQRDTWHFEPAVKMLSSYGNVEHVTDIMLDKDRLVVFTLDDLREYECHDFAYGELGKIIEALPDADAIVLDNAVSDLKVMTTNLRIDCLLADAPFKYEVGSKHYVVDDVKCVNGTLSLVQALGNDTPVSDLPTEVVVNLRDHIHITYLHTTKYYKEVMAWLALEPNLGKSVDEYTKTNYGCVLFKLKGTDIEFDMSSIQRDDKGNLVIFGADTCCEDELITLTEKDIEPEYLFVILEWMHTRANIMNTYNGHNKELVDKINAAWKSDKYHDRFADILFALGCRDKEEIQATFGIEINCNETAMENAHEIMEHICDDWDLETILSFIRYKEK